MNNETKTIEELEHLRKVRASQVKVLPEVKIPSPAVDSLLAAFEKELKSPTEPDKIVHDDSWREEMAKAETRRIKDRIKTSWNAPLRQVLMENPDRSGEWGKMEVRLKAKLGSGFLLALVGTRGNGKTQLGVELMRHLAEHKVTSHYCTASEFFMAIRATYKPNSQTTEEDVIIRYRDKRLIVLDEIGRRGQSEWEDRMLFELLDKRYGDMSDTLLISNQERAEFTTAIGPSIASRMQETGGIIECTWTSFRKAH